MIFYDVYWAWRDNFTNLTVYDANNSMSEGYVDIDYNRRMMWAQSPLGIDNVTVPVNYPISNITDMLVYSRSTLAESTTPATRVVYDWIANVHNHKYVSQDLINLLLRGCF